MIQARRQCQMKDFVNMIAGSTSNRHYTAAITWLTCHHPD